MRRDKQAKIWQNDILNLRETIQIGDTITTKVSTDELGERLVRPIQINRQVVAKHPFLVELDRRGSKIETITYADLITGQGGKLYV